MLRTLGIRTYATAATKSTAPPMIPAGLAGKYAGALFTAAAKSSPKALAQVETDFKALRQLMKSSPQVATFLTNPTLSSSEKQAGLADITKGLGGSTSEFTKNFLNVLAENGRLYETEKVAQGFEEIMAAHRGELQVTIHSAEALDKATIDRLKKSIDTAKISKEYTTRMSSTRSSQTFSAASSSTSVTQRRST